METYQAIVLGILQGLTEFLPVSSSGHLALGQYLFAIKEPALFFDVSLHVGTLLAVAVVFFKDIRSMVQALFELVISMLKSDGNVKRKLQENPDIRLVLLIITGSIPTALLGLFIKQYIDLLFGSINFVGTMLLVTGTFLWLTKDVKKSESGIMEMGYKQAILIGLCQGMAVFPGISRSGATISAALFSGIGRETAARFSFLLSIPAILGAEVLSFRDFLSQGISFDFSVIYGTLVSFVVGYLALIILLRIVRKGRLHLFAPYCWIVGVMAIVAGVL